MLSPFSPLTLFVIIGSPLQLYLTEYDEFDAFYHTELAEQVYKLLKRQTGSDHLQCVMTTHNTNLLSNKIGRPDSFYIVTPQKIAAMSSLTSREIREGNNIENLYLGKAFGVL